MITDNGTKLPVACAEVASSLGVDSDQVRGCLVQLGNEGIVRELDRGRGKWEIAHDFIAGLYFQILAGWRASVWGRARPWIIAAGIGVWLAAVLSLPELLAGWQESKTLRALGSLGFSAAPCDRDISTEPGCLSVRLEVSQEPNGLGQFPLRPRYKGKNQEPSPYGPYGGPGAYLLAPAIPYLKELTSLRFLDLSFSTVTNVDALKELTQLQGLDVSFTGVENIDALKELSGLRTLTLSVTQVENIDALEGLSSLQQLTLSRTRVKNIDALKGLSGLQQLDLSSTKVENIDALKGLSGLQQLDLSNTKVENIDALKTALPTTEISWSPRRQ